MSTAFLTFFDFLSNYSYYSLSCEELINNRAWEEPLLYGLFLQLFIPNSHKSNRIYLAFLWTLRILTPYVYSRSLIAICYRDANIPLSYIWYESILSNTLYRISFYVLYPLRYRRIFSIFPLYKNIIYIKILKNIRNKEERSQRRSKSCKWI